MTTRATKPKPQLLFYEIADGVTAFSSMRHGGYGQGNYGEFTVNAFCGDVPQTIAMNRQLLCEELGITEDRLLIPHQVHGTEVCQIRQEDLQSDVGGNAGTMACPPVLEGVDAVMTDVRGVCVGVSTADCIPIIIYDPEHHAVCVVHAGWRGTVKRIVRKAVLMMTEVYQSCPTQMRAVIGPGISFDNFEVGDEVYDQFEAAAFPMEHISRRLPAMDGSLMKKWHIDLWACNRLQLQAEGVLPEYIEVAGICTYDSHDDFFSARRLGIASGRILTGVVLR